MILKGKIVDLKSVFVCVYVCDCVWIYVCVCDFGLKNPKSKFLFLILGWAGLVMRDGARGARGACGGGFGSREKIRLINGSGSGHGSWPAGRVQV